MKTIDFSEFRKDFSEAVKGVEEKYKIRLGVGTINFNSTSFHTTLNGLMNNTDEICSMEELAFRKICYSFGKNPEDFGKTFIHNSEVFRFVGINPKARKYPYLGERVSDGKRFKFYSVDLS